MKWSTLHNKIGKQTLNLTQHTDVVVLIDDKEVPVVLKFNAKGIPYLEPIDKEK